MVTKKFVGAKLSNTIYQKLQIYKEEKGIDTDSEAIRDIVRRFLTEVWRPSSSSHHSRVQIPGREGEKEGGVVYNEEGGD